jgi:hypothetical protein
VIEGAPGRYRAVVCEVLYREACLCAAQSANMIDLDFVSQGLHDIDAPEMARRIQDRIDAAAADRYAAVLLGFALCNNGIVGVRARDIPVVIARAHDCITLFLGSKERYREQSGRAPGTYYRTTGWVERDSTPEDLGCATKMHKLGLDRAYDDYVREYGEENARYIWQTIQGGLVHYDTLAYIEMGLGGRRSYEDATRREAAERGWRFALIPGDLSLLRRLFAGEWEEKDFLVVPPGRGIVATNDEDIVGIG